MASETPDNLTEPELPTNTQSTGDPTAPEIIEHTIRAAGRNALTVVKRICVGTAHWFVWVVAWVRDWDGQDNIRFAKKHSAGKPRDVNQAKALRQSEVRINTIVAISIIFLWLIGWFWFTRRFSVGSWVFPAVTLAVNVAIGTARGPAQKRVKADYGTDRKPTSIGGVSTTAVIEGLRATVPAIETAYNQEERRVAKAVKDGLLRQARFIHPIEPFDLVRNGSNGIVTSTIMLPSKATVKDVQKEKDRLAGKLGKDPRAVWVETINGVPNQMLLTVLPKPLEQMTLPKWEHLNGQPVDVFEGYQIGWNGQLLPVYMEAATTHTGYAGMTNTGKSNALRIDFVAWCLDPTTQVAAFNFSGNREFEAMEHFALAYRKGSSNDDVQAFYDFLKWVIDVEFPRRVEALASLPLSKVPSGSLGRDAVNADPSLGCLRIYVDEFGVPLAHDVLGPKIMGLMERIAKEARKAGITLTIATQRWTKDSIPGGLKSQLQNISCFRMSGATEAYFVLGDRWVGPAPQEFPPDATNRGLSVLKGNYKLASGHSADICKWPLIEIAGAKELLAHREPTDLVDVEGVNLVDDPVTVVDELLSVWRFDPVTGDPAPRLPIAWLVEQLTIAEAVGYAADDQTKSRVSKQLRDMNVATKTGTRWIEDETGRAFSGRAVEYQTLQDSIQQGWNQ